MSSSESETNTARVRAFAGESRLRVALFAVVVPVQVWIINTGLMNAHVLRRDLMGLGTLAVYVIFVAETALISWTVGRYMQHAR